MCWPILGAPSLTPSAPSFSNGSCSGNQYLEQRCARSRAAKRVARLRIGRGGGRSVFQGRPTRCGRWLPVGVVNVVRGRERALSVGERMILELMGSIAEGEQPGNAADRRNIDRRWLRRNALELLTGLARYCDDSDEARAAWVAELHALVRTLGLTYRQGITERRYFQSRGRRHMAPMSPVRCRISDSSNDSRGQRQAVRRGMSCHPAGQPGQHSDAATALMRGRTVSMTRQSALCTSA